MTIVGARTGHVMREAFVVRYRTTAEAADENERLVQAVYAELAERRPEGLLYSTYRLADGVTFVHVALGGGAVLPEVAAFQEFQRELGARLDGGPLETSTATIVGRYVPPGAQS
jgi:hypothetical protein